MLELKTIRRGPEDNRYSWMPFEPNTNFNAGWWDMPPYITDEPWYVHVQVLRGGEEIARVELDDHFPGSLPLGAPKLGAQALEIQFIEVVPRHRRQGVGKEVIAALSAANPDRRLVALSEGADNFWASLGWDRYDYSDGSHHYRPLFVQKGVL